MNAEALPGTLAVAVFRKDSQQEFKSVGSVRRDRSMKQLIQRWSSHENISAQELTIDIDFDIPSTWI